MIGILCGLESEKKIAVRIDGALVACSAARPQRAKKLARELVAGGATRLMSFGIGGSLHSSLHLGDIVIGTHVTSATGQRVCDEAWGGELAAKIPDARRGGVYGSEVLVSTAGAKASLYQQTGCVIVDMESQWAAEVAAEEGLPLMVVRAVCDDCMMNVPPFLIAAIAEDGSFSLSKALGHLAFHPFQTGDFKRVIRGTGSALRSLKAIRDALS